VEAVSPAKTFGLEIGLRIDRDFAAGLGTGTFRSWRPKSMVFRDGYSRVECAGTWERIRDGPEHSVSIGGFAAQVGDVSSRQLRAWVPSELKDGITNLTVTVDGKTSAPVGVVVSRLPWSETLIGQGSVSAYPAIGTAAPAVPLLGPTDTAPASTGIVYTCDPTIVALSPHICNTLNSTIAGLYANAFTNANANIYIRAAPGPLATSGYSFSSLVYGLFRSFVLGSDPTVNPAAWPVADPYPTMPTGIAFALQRALGIANKCSAVTGASGCYDGIITMQSDARWYFRTGAITSRQLDFFSVVAHETDEIRGTASCALGCGYLNVFPADYFRNHSDGTRSFGAGTNNPCSSPDSTNACFSLDGIHMLQQYNNVIGKGDAGDWITVCANPHVQDEAFCEGNAGVDISPAAEIPVLGAIGYTLRNPKTSGGVTGVTSPTPDGAYGPGAQISIRVAFSEAVSGAPSLALNSGGAASYSSGSGTATLTFLYVVGAGDASQLLDCTSTGSLTLNGGTIAGAGGISESLKLPIPGFSGSLGASSRIVIDPWPTAITIQTNPPGLQFAVDGGAPQVAALTLRLPQGPHTLAVGPLQTESVCAGYGYTATATIHHQFVAANANNYTVTLAGTWPQFATAANGGNVTNANGHDICFANAANTIRLSWEIESYNGATGALAAHVMVGSVSATADTVFSVYYGNKSINAFQGGAAAAWDTNTYPYAGIWHFANTGTNQVNGSDSSQNANDLTNNGVTSVSGKIGSGGAFSSTYMEASPSSSLDFSGPVSFSYWANPVSSPNLTPLMVSRTGCNDGNWQIYNNVSGGLYFNFWGTSNSQAFTSILLANGAWSHVAITWDGFNARYFVNGTLTKTVALSGARNSNANTFDVGTDTCGGFYQGLLDEVRIAQGAWPASLIQTMYNNQSSPGTFVTLSGMTAVSPDGGTGVPYQFTNWSDGGAATHTINVGVSPATYTANFALADKPPVISEGFNPAAIFTGGTSALTLTLSNGNADALTGGSFTDTLVNMNTAGGAVTGTCRGTTPSTLAAGQTALSFTGIAIPSPGSCTVVFNVTSSMAGAQNNAASGVTTTQTPVAGLASNMATLTVSKPIEVCPDLDRLPPVAPDKRRAGKCVVKP
jgi:hypothetical protein